MPKKSSNAGQRVWSLLRVVLFWARKGGVFRRRLMVELQLVPKFLKNIGHINSRRRNDQIGYIRKYELSFDKTPVFHVPMHRPHSMRFLVPRIPCINPQIEFDYDFDGEGGADVAYGCKSCDSVRKSFIEDGGFDYEEKDEGEDIDLRAEEFIAKFYEQMKLQRQISYLQYNQ
ncbi:uncharacterized protein LOC116211590 [Punica granatum]|uniref:Uncharacterized protein LOC116211590 n=1 Tax=Punica granatum TaxID=22663 RepID=A0A6P8E9K8_PUNGR|nr:uncharacterized protein LOC116211590 [Punica granatum]